MQDVSYKVEAVDRETVDVTVLFGSKPDHTERVTLAQLADAASQLDRDLAEAYGRILRDAQAAVWQLEAARNRALLQESIDACTGHQVDETCDERCYTGCVAHEPYTACNPASHGNVVVTETCRCGAARSRAVNQCHEEVGPWGNPL